MKKLHFRLRYQKHRLPGIYCCWWIECGEWYSPYCASAKAAIKFAQIATGNAQWGIQQ